MERKTPFPGEFIRFEVTSKCSVGCRHCYVDDDTWGMEDLDIEEIEKILNSLKKYRPLKILFLGGDPFDRENFLEILEMAKEKGFDVSIDTSGKDLTKDKLDRIIELDANLNISTYGFNEDINDHFTYDGHFRDIVKILNYCEDRDFPVDIAFLLTRVNFSQVFNIEEFIKKYDVDDVHLDVYMNFSGRENEFELTYSQFILFWLFLRFYNLYPSAHSEISNLERLEGLLERNPFKTKVSPCEQNTAPMIKPNGDLWPCIFYGESVGNLKEDNVHETIGKLFDYQMNKENCIDCIKTKIPRSYKIKSNTFNEIIYRSHRIYNKIIELF